MTTTTQPLPQQDDASKVQTGTGPAAEATASDRDRTRPPHPGQRIACGGDLTVDLQTADGVLILALVGAVGATSRLGLYSAINDAFASAPIRMVIDGSGITGCDQIGLATFVDAAERANDSGIPLSMGGLDTRHQRLLFQLWGVSITEDLSHPTRERALSAVAGQPTRSDPSRERLLENLHRLHRAVSASRVVEQATGVLMATVGVDAEAALELMQRHAKSHGVDLLSVASSVIAVVATASATAPNATDLDGLLSYGAG